MLTAEIIAIGSELLTPRFQDTNSLYLTEQLNRTGIAVAMKTVAGDDEKYLEHAIRNAMDRSPLVITIGGLGPTADDITRKIVSQVTSRQLVLDDAILENLKARFAARGMEMAPNNARQALVPSGAEVLPNANGTAPGLWIEHEASLVILLPGPSAELRAMFENHCLPRLSKKAGAGVINHRIYRTTGLGESALDSRISPIYSRYRNPETTVLSKPGQVDIHLSARARSAEEAETLLGELGGLIENEIGEYVFSTGPQEMEEIVGMYLVMRQATVSVAESCTGGLVAERLTRVPGSSRYFRSGVVAYSNESKIELAGIPPLLLQMEGAVSKEVAVGLAESIREKTATSIGIGVTGVAGPDGGSPEKPVGTVHIAVAVESGTRHRQFVFPGTRDRVRWQASQAALDMTRRILIEA
jgi:nicotinamide-nucleotide amidase